MAPAHTGGFDAGVRYNNFTARHLEVTQEFDGIKAHGDATIDCVWLHLLDGSSGEGNMADGYPHTDGVQIGSGSHVSVTHSRIEGVTGNGGVFADPDGGPISDLTVESNFIDHAGNYGIFIIPSPNNPAAGRPRDVVIENNVLGRSYCDCGWSGYGWINATNVTWSNNRSDLGTRLPYETFSEGDNRNLKIGP
jgi:hypothetical protein